MVADAVLPPIVKTWEMSWENVVLTLTTELEMSGFAELCITIRECWADSVTSEATVRMLLESD